MLKYGSSTVSLKILQSGPLLKDPEFGKATCSMQDAVKRSAERAVQGLTDEQLATALRKRGERKAPLCALRACTGLVRRLPAGHAETGGRHQRLATILAIPGQRVGVAQNCLNLGAYLLEAKLVAF